MNGTLMPAPTAAAATAAHAAGCLASGTASSGGYQLRAAGPQDADAIRDFVSGLSVRTQYFRFFTAVSPPSRGLLRALSGGGRRADILLVTDEQGRVVGHGMAVDDDQDRADIGLVIADRWQGQGLGTSLLRLLVARARRRGISALQLEVLPANTRMLGIIDRHWPDAARKRTPDALSITAPIAGTRTVPAIAFGRGRDQPARPAA